MDNIHVHDEPLNSVEHVNDNLTFPRAFQGRLIDHTGIPFLGFDGTIYYCHIENDKNKSDEFTRSNRALV